jgi:hypothetical protein
MASGCGPHIAPDENNEPICTMIPLMARCRSSMSCTKSCTQRRSGLMHKHWNPERCMDRERLLFDFVFAMGRLV